jgi:hypothetical protein
MFSKTYCAAVAAALALSAASIAAKADDLRPIGVCIDKPGTGTFVGVGVWTACTNAASTARSKARGFAEGFARSGCPRSLSLAEGNRVCRSRGGTLIRTNPALSNDDNYAISISASRGSCARIRDVGLSSTFASAKNCGIQPPPGWIWPWFGNWAQETATATDHATCGYVCSK